MKINFFLMLMIIVFHLYFIDSIHANMTIVPLSFDIEARPGINLSISVHMLINDNNPDKGSTIFFIHGLSHTADTYKPWTESIYNDNNFSKEICRMIYIDLPGRGESSVPPGSSGLLFGDLNLDDYSTIIIESLQRLKLMDIYPTVIIGHSMGGLLIQMVQQRLLDQGSSLRKMFEINSAIMLAPVFPRELAWDFADSGTANLLISPYITTTPELGYYMDLPAEVWISLFFCTSNGTLVPGAPTPEEVLSLNYSSKEALAAVSQMIGYSGSGYERPSISGGIFTTSNKTRLYMVSYMYDSLFFVYPEEHEDLYLYLTGGKKFKYFYSVETSYAVHDMHISSPEDLNSILLDILQVVNK